MNQEQIVKEISLIKNMIERTRREAADSGDIFIFIGTGCVIYIAVIMILNMLNLSQWILKAMIIMTIIMGILGYLIIGRKEKKEKVISYPKTLCYMIIVFCCFAMLLTGFLFPLTHVYPWDIAPIFSAILFGIMLFSTAVIYQLSFFYWSAIISWIGACLMAYLEGAIDGIIMIVILLAGFIIPGIILNRRYKNGSK
jgi:hypothetical protein